MARYEKKQISDKLRTGGILVLLFFAMSHLLHAQGYFFSQYKSAPLFVNPALAGYEENISFGLNYRLQNQVDISYHTGQFFAILPLYVQGQEKNHIGGIGISALSDVAGQRNEVKTYGYGFASAYNMKLDQYEIQSFSFGLQASYVQTRIDFGVLDWPSQITYKGFDHTIVPDEQIGDQVGYFSFNAGALWSYDSRNKRREAHNDYRLHLGVSMAHLNKPDRSLIDGDINKLPILYKAHGGGIFEVNEDVRVAPDFLLMMQDQNFLYNVGASVSYTTASRSSTKFENDGISLRVGSWYRVQDSFIFLIGAGNENFDAAISYDINASRERTNIRNQGALELSVAYRILRENNLKKIQTPLY